MAEEGGGSRGNPTVSVIVCVRDAKSDVEASLASIRRQEIDSSDFSIEIVAVLAERCRGAALPALQDAGVRIVEATTDRMGGVRKRGVEKSSGDWIAWCDAGDRWPDGYMAAALAIFRAQETAALTAAWPGEPADAPASAVVVSRRAAALAGGFDPHLTAFEDWDLWHRIARFARLERMPLEIECAPDNERADPALNREDWERVRADDNRFHQRVRRNARVREYAPNPTFDPSIWQGGQRRLLFQASLDAERSFGFVARRLIEGLNQRGLDVAVGPFRQEPAVGFERFWRPLWRAGHVGFIIDYLVGPSCMGCERVVYYATHESTEVRQETIQEINENVTLLLVPCRWNLDVYRACGVTVPIRYLPHGVDPDRFPFLDRPKRDIFTIGSFGDLSARKGTDVLVRAFLEEFDPSEPVRLLLKRTYDHELHEIDWPEDLDPRRVEVRTGFLDQPALLEFLREMDLFVLPSRGEGFGLCGLEAMATGLPVAATNWSGPADYLDLADSLPLAFRMVEAGGEWVSHTRYFGEWAEPDLADLRSRMRWAYEHRTEAAAMGERAARRVQRDWTWERSLDQLESYLEAVAAGITPA